LAKINYSQLQQLHEKYSSSGLSILAFPSNQFNQEKGSNAEIKNHVKEKYGVQFDMFSKVSINGENADALFKYLQNHPNTTGLMVNDIKWNYTKFLTDKDGVPWKRYGPKDAPMSFENDIKSKL